jgi:hypothetical protein
MFLDYEDYKERKMTDNAILTTYNKVVVDLANFDDALNTFINIVIKLEFFTFDTGLNSKKLKSVCGKVFNNVGVFFLVMIFH